MKNLTPYILSLVTIAIIGVFAGKYIKSTKLPKNKYTLYVTDIHAHESILYVEAYNHPTQKDSRILADDKVVMDSVSSFWVKEVYGRLMIEQ